MKRYNFFYFILLFLFACNQNVQEQNKNPFIPKITYSKGTWINPDSVQSPKKKLAGIPKIVLAGKPTIVPTNLNIHISGLPKNVNIDSVKTNTPGTDTFSLPKTVPATSKVTPCHILTAVIAKDMVCKDLNSANFSFFKTLQGLKGNSVKCMLQDQRKNIWFGTYGSGVSRYDGKLFTNFTEKEGLANNIIFCILEDKKGNIWFGTGGGVSCYDGKYFTNFTEKDGLVNNVVYSIVEDRKGNIWFGTYGGGVSCYDGNSFINFTEKEGLVNNIVLSILEDKKGTIWFGTYGGISNYDGKSFTNFTQKQGLANNAVFCILEDKNKNIWFGTYGGGISRYDGKSFSTFTEKEGLAKNIVMSMLEDRKGNIWIATEGAGVSCYDGKNFTNFSEKEGLVVNVVFSILEDNNDNLWFGTNGGGVSRYDGKSFTNFSEKEGLGNNVIFSIVEDKKGILWFGTYGGGVSRYDGKSFTNFTSKEGLATNVIYNILEDKKGNIWFGTNGGGASCYDGKFFTNFSQKEGLANDVILCSIEDKKGNIWFGTNGGGVSCYDGKSFTNFTQKEGIVSNIIYSIHEDENENIWFATNSGISRYDGKCFTNFTEKDGLTNNNVYCILEDNNGIFWFGTNGGGVSRYDGKSFMNLTEKEGLINNSVLNALQDKEGNIWFGTRNGLSKVNSSQLMKLNNISKNYYPIKEALFYNYGYNDGFIGLNCSRNSVLQDTKGRIWWGADVLTCYKPRGDITDTAAPIVNLTSIKLYGEEISWSGLGAVYIDSTGKEIITGHTNDTALANGVLLKDIFFDGITKWYNLPEHLSLPYNNNDLTFNFIGVHMQSHNHIKYQYKLEGIDPDWSSITEKTEAPYGNLPSGNYIFKVMAMNQSGRWSPPFEFKFLVRPPWWQTWWFRIILIIFIISCIWLYIIWRERKLKAEKEILEYTVGERTAEIVKQKNVIEEQKHLVEEKHKEITDSINYAERIQRSLLASAELLNENLKDYFVFFKPKDIVSGDFYWANKLDNGRFILATADSTGHGVPGAIMSILNISCIEKAIEAEKLINPCDILNHTRAKIIETLKKDGSEEGGKDGMDCSLISFDFKNKKLIYSAANNPLWIVRNKEILEFAPDKMPIGKHAKDSISFTQHTIELQKEDIIYTFTDGVSDQFGGLKGKKFMHKQLKQLLISIADLSMSKQKETIETTLNIWKGDLEQVDDITIIGIKI